MGLQIYFWVFILFCLTKVLGWESPEQWRKEGIIKDQEQKNEASVGGASFGSICPYFLLLEISKCSVPNGSFFPGGIPIRQVAAFQQMVI